VPNLFLTNTELKYLELALPTVAKGVFENSKIHYKSISLKVDKLILKGGK